MKRNILYSNVVIFCSSFLVGCSGGGGGGGPTIPTQTTPLYTDQYQFPQTNTHIPDNLNQVKAQVAHDNGFTGGPISVPYSTGSSDKSNRNLQTVVAVLDSGINPNHYDFSDPNKIIGWKDFTATNGLTPYDVDGHGTFVSHIIAGQRQGTYDDYYGIAYGAQILSGQIINSDGTSTNIQLQNAIDWVVQQKTSIDIPNTRKLVSVNLSLGTNDASFVNSNFEVSFISALQAGLTFVVAAGNESLDCLPDKTGSLNNKCSFPAASPWVSAHPDQYLNSDGGWIVVGSVDANNNISSFSNKAGVTKNNYLVAPGENVIAASNNNNNGYCVGSGTSFSTPLVTGAIALMAQKWPYLTGRQNAQILFDTATDLGAPGIDNVYGNGLLNLTKAFNPVGTITIPLASATAFETSAHRTTLTNTQLTTSSSMFSLKSLIPLNETIGLDSYSRDFKVEVTNGINSNGLIANSFDNYITMNVGNVLLGYEQLSHLPMVGYQFDDNTRVKLSYDNKSLLGLYGTGALAIGNSFTTYSNLEHDFSFDRYTLNLSANYAYGQAESTSSSLISNISPVHALGGSIRASYNGFGAGYEIPLRVISGKISFNTPTDVDNTGHIIFSSIVADLAPTTFEQKYSLFYKQNFDNMSLFAQVAKTTDAFGLHGYINNEASVNFALFF
jgi:subtilisin family serine protease